MESLSTLKFGTDTLSSQHSSMTDFFLRPVAPSKLLSYEEEGLATPINFARGDSLAHVRSAFPCEPAPRLPPRSRVDPQQVVLSSV